MRSHHGHAGDTITFVAPSPSMASTATQEPILKSLQEENARLRRAVEELSILNDLARAIGASLNTQEIIQTIIRRSLKALNAEQGVITLVEEQSSLGMRTLVRTMVSSSDHEQFHFNQTLLGWMHLNKKPLIINDPKNDDRFRGLQWDESIRSLICVPMMVKSELRGVITVYNKKSGSSFTDDDQRLLAIIATQSAQVVENARLYEKEQTLSRMQEEVRLASKIQYELLPKEAPTIPGYQIAGKTIPAQQVGGDYFDFVKVDDHRIAISIGDVSGKGLPASLLMANLQATLRSQTYLAVPPKVALERANALLYQSTSPEKFATLFYAILDFQSHQITFSNAGHENPFFFGLGDDVRRLRTGGIPLGMLPAFTYEEETVAFDPGGGLVIFSDGVSEAMNADEQLFGDERIVEVLGKHREASAQELIDHSVDAVKRYAGTYPQTDDITLLVVRRAS
jgi:sigma-B regulation protein RsbU (phosphoserine phosphatase)